MFKRYSCGRPNPIMKAYMGCGLSGKYLSIQTACKQKNISGAINTRKNCNLIKIKETKTPIMLVEDLYSFNIKYESSFLVFSCVFGG